MSDWHISIAPQSAEEQTEDGPREVTVYTVWATSPDGTRYEHERLFSRLEDAERLVRVEGHDRFSPLDSQDWHPIQPVYGSQQYERTGGDEAHHGELQWPR